MREAAARIMGSALVAPGLGALVPEPAEIDRRLRARLRPGELFGLIWCLFVVGLYAWLSANGKAIIYDYRNYMAAGRGDDAFFFYAYWFHPVFELFSRLPFEISYLLWSAIQILGLWLAARVFGGRMTLTLVGFQVLYTLGVGQVVGLMLGALTLAWWALAHRRWDLAGLGILIASAKYQTGVPLALFMLLMARISWRERLRVLAVPAAVALLSLIAYPGWPLALVHRIQTNVPNSAGSATLWDWIGAFALLLWLPVLWLPLDRPRRWLALVTTLALTSPYFQQTDLLALFVMPAGWLPVLVGNLGYLHLRSGYPLWGKILVVVPLLVYLGLVVPAARAYWRARRGPVVQEAGSNP